MIYEKENLLLHSCCAPCSPYVMKLLSEKYNISIFFYNPNIHPKEEYELRVNEIKKLCAETGTDLILGDYDTDLWFQSVKGLENEPEKGKRCEICFRLRLKSCMQKAEELKIPYVTTTLTVSPLKNASTINFIGNNLALEYGIHFLAENFKKQNGFKLTCELAKEYNFYRQNYCGCIFSQRIK